MVHFKARALTVWEQVRFSYWFVPALMSTAAGVASFITLRIDRVHGGAEAVRWFYTGDPDGARVLLSSIAASMIGIAGVVFSITIVALTLTSNQFGPRLLRNFMRDLSNQVVLGTFTAAFVYCMLILRTVHGETGRSDGFIPQLSLFTAFMFSIAGLGVLIYFIHHTARVIQAPVVIASVASDMQGAARELPDEGPGDHPHRHLPPDFDAHCKDVRAAVSGYIQRIEMDDVMEEAIAHDLLILFTRRAGQYVQENEPVLAVYPGNRVDDRIISSLQQTFSIAEVRTLAQDPEYAIDQLVEIAMRALSPGVNDPMTAVQCVDRLGEGLSLIAQRCMPQSLHYDKEGKLRLCTWEYSFAAFLNTALSRIRQCARNSLPVLIRMIDVLTRVARVARDDDRRAAIAEHAREIYEVAHEIASGSAIDVRSLDHHFALFTAAMRSRQEIHGESSDQ